MSPNACLGSNGEGERGEGKAPKLPVMVLCILNKIAWGSLAATSKQCWVCPDLGVWVGA